MKSKLKDIMLLLLLLSMVQVSYGAYPKTGVQGFAMNEDLPDTLRWSSRHVFYGKDGKLEYTADDQGNIIPDFSHVGYHYGDEPIPDVPVVKEISPVEGDDYINIQGALNAVAALPMQENGYRGALLLKKGTYHIKGSILIRADGVVIRGEGDSEEGTVIYATGPGQRALIDVGVDAGLSTDQNTKTKIKESYVPVGRKFVRVENPEFFSAGDDIAIYRPGTQQWISDIRMDRITQTSGVVQWRPAEYSFYFERVISHISGDTLFFRNPVVMAMEDNYGGGYVLKCSMPRYKHIGIEDLLLKSEYVHDTDEDHAWYGILFRNAEHSWVRNVTSRYFGYSCVSVGWDAKHISVLNCTSLDPKSQIAGGRRYSFNLEGQLSLFKNCFASNGRHDYVTSARVCGPNVFTQSTAEYAWSDAGPHHRWAMGTLYDSIVTSGQLNVQDRDNSGTGHGWAGVNQVFWNCRGSSSICQSPWASGRNYNIGFQGYKDAGWKPDRPDGEWEGQNVPDLFPSSLYEAQLEDRTSDKRYFSVISALGQITDSSYLLSFNLPVNQAEAVLKNNYLITGTAGVQHLSWDVSLENENQVLFTFHDIPLLQPFATIIIDAADVHSSAGDRLNGLVRAGYTEPDKRPVVYYDFQRVDNGPDSYVRAISSKTGKMYLVRYDLEVNSASDLENAIAAGEGLVMDIEKEATSVIFYTLGLPENKYIFFAVDEDGRVSRQPAKFVYIEEATGVGLDQANPDFKIFPGIASLRIVKQSDEYRNAGIAVFSIDGKLQYQGLCHTELEIPLSPGSIYFVRIKTPGYTSVRKIFLR